MMLAPLLEAFQKWNANGDHAYVAPRRSQPITHRRKGVGDAAELTFRGTRCFRGGRRIKPSA